MEPEALVQFEMTEARWLKLAKQWSEVPEDETGPHLRDDIGASDELPENGKYRRVGEARLINLAFVDLADNVQGELPAHVVTASELRGKKIARMIQCAAHDPQTLGIIDMPDAAGRGHSGLASTLTARCAVSLFDPRTRTNGRRV